MKHLLNAQDQVGATEPVPVAASVSVIVPTYNRAGYIEECLDSLVGQTVPPLEVIVVDDGSEDDTAARVARYGSRVRYLRKENGGKPSAVNLGASIASGEWIWIFDDDDVALPDAIERRLESLAAKPDAGFVYGPHLLGSDGADGRITAGRLNIPPQHAEEAFFLEIMKGCFFHLGTALVRRKYFDILGGLDPALLSGEDYDFQIRLAQRAMPSYCPSPVFIFRQHAGLRGAKAVRHGASQRSAVFRKYSMAVGQKLRSAFSLGEFLVPRSATDLSAEQTRSALLNRIHVMANHGCLDEMIEDLRSLVETRQGADALGRSEQTAIAAAMRAGWAYCAASNDWPRFLAQVRALRSRPSGRTALMAMAKGLLGLARSYPGTVHERLLKLWRAARLAVAASH